MEEKKKKLYPMTFAPTSEEFSWGSETLLCADLGYADSVIENGFLSESSLSDAMETYLERVVGDNVYEFYGRQFPVLARVLTTKARTPLWACPDDEIASQRWDSLGKEKIWYIAKAEKGAKVAIGLRREMDASEFYQRCVDGSIGALLEPYAANEGDFFTIPPGVVHCASAGLQIVEISEASALDFIIAKWDGEEPEEEFGVVDALDWVRLQAGVPEKEDENCTCHDHHHEHGHGHGHEIEKITETITEEDFPFNLTKVNLTDPLHIYTEKFASFLLYTCTKGSASIQVPSEGDAGKGMETYSLPSGRSILVPAECPDFFLVPMENGTTLLEVSVTPYDRADEYIDPSAESHLPGEDDDDFDDEEECSCGHHHHHEDGECSCGHHHHHDEDGQCSCGHHHHHDE